MPADEETVRPATQGDVEPIRRVARTSWHAAYDGILGDERVDDTVDRWYDEEGVGDSIANPDHAFYVVERREKLVGFVHLGPAARGDETYELFRIYLHPEHWGEGIGSRLLDRGLAAVEERAERVRLRALAANEIGVRFYESRGFERVAAGEDEIDGETYRVYTYAKEL